jgi:cell division protein FtsI (penicillin-binding protein 3)
VFEESHRHYPNNDLAAQVLGFVGSDEKGLGGLEYQYEEALAGSSGKVVYIKDGRRRYYNQSEQPAQSGANLVTTLDKNVQFIVRQAVHDAVARTHASAIYVGVMDLRNGAILATENYPSFDPNNWRDYNPQFRKNGAIEHTYEPGSTFKILTVGAALEEGLTTPDERIDCLLGSIVVAGQRIHDHKPFGVLTVSEIMEKSSDVGAITLGLRLKEERMAQYIKKFGFGKKTGIDLPGEESGLTKSVSKWNRSSIGYMSMGQEIGVTPLQVVSLVSMVANGGTLYRPYVVKEVHDAQHGVDFAHRAGRPARHVPEERSGNAGEFERWSPKERRRPRNWMDTALRERPELAQKERGAWPTPQRKWSRLLPATRPLPIPSFP